MKIAPPSKSRAGCIPEFMHTSVMSYRLVHGNDIHLSIKTPLNWKVVVFTTHPETSSDVPSWTRCFCKKESRSNCC